MKNRTDKELTTYFKEVRKYPLLSIEETDKVARLVQKGNHRARNKLIRSNLRLVIKIAKKYQTRGLSLPDLIEEGNIGLVKAVTHYKPAKGRFSTYAGFWIKEAIRRALFTSVKTIRIPCHVIETISKWKNANTKLSQKLGRFPNPDEVYDEMGLSFHNLCLFKKTLKTGLSVSRLTNLDDLIEPLSENHSTNLTHFFTREEKEWIDNLLNKITPKESLVLKLRFGLEENRPIMRLREIAKEIGYSYEGIRRIEKMALRKLHSAIAKRG